MILIDQGKRWSRCKFFNGTANAQCEAGVSYGAVARDHDPIEFRRTVGGKPVGVVQTSRRSLPCIPSHNLGGAVCDKCVCPTPEEIAAEEREAAERMERFSLCRDAIVAHLGGPWKRGTPGAAGAGAIDCPACKAERSLRFSRAGINGHIHAHCETKGCASWIE